MITQSDLAHYRGLKELSQRVAEDLRKSREALLAKHADGVESGEFKVKVESSSSQSFSYDAIVDLLGRPEANRLKSLLPAKVSQVLTVTGP